MAVRRESVLLQVEGNFAAEMIAAAAATRELRDELDRLGGAGDRSDRIIRDNDRDTERLGNTSRRTSSDIDRLSGRISILAKVGASLGPALAPIGAIGIAAVAGLASQVGFAVLGMGTLVAASQGVGDALKAVNDAALSPTAANLEKARQAMALLGPEAQAFVSRFQEIRPALAEIRDSAAAGWFPGLTEALGSFESMAPQVANLFQRIGEAGGQLVADGAEALAGPEWSDFRAFLLNEAPGALDTFGRTIGNVTAGMAELWMAFAPLNRSFADTLLSASRSFKNWAADLGETKGFQDFIDYIRETGPQVAEAMSSIGNAFLQIIQAAAPLGGPVLQTLGLLADAIAAIADSPLGEPIMAMVTAMSAASLAAKAFTGALGALGVTATSTTGRLAGLRAMAAQGLPSIAVAASIPDLLRLQDSISRSDAAAKSHARTLKELESAIQDSNVGLYAKDLGIDVSKLAEDLFYNGKSGEYASKVLKQLSRDSDGFGNSMEALGGDILPFYTSGANKAFEASDDLNDILNRNGKSLAAGAEDARQAEAAQLGLSDATAATAEAMGISNAEMARSISLLDARTQATLGAFDAETQLRQAIRAAREQGANNNAGIRGNTEAALKNREALSGLAAAWGNQREALENAGASAGRIESKYRVARRAFIETATAMGVPIKQARTLANTLLAIPESKATRIIAKADISAAEAAIGRLTRPREVKITASTNANIAEAVANSGRYVGGYTGRGGKYEPAGIVHRGEVVIPQELVRRDRSMLMARYGQLPNMNELGSGYASGGLVTRRRRRLSAAESRLSDLRSEASSLSSSVTDRLRSDLFGGDPWSEGGDPLSILRADIARARTLNNARALLAKKGVRGGALEEILANATPEQAMMLANGPAANLKEYARLFKQRESFTASVGRAAGTAAYGPQINAVAREVRALRRELVAVTKKEHRDDRKDRQGRARKAARSQNRGTVR